ncbi:unnamed protein product [Rhizopus stolonifer]
MSSSHVNIDSCSLKITASPNSGHDDQSASDKAPMCDAVCATQFLDKMVQFAKALDRSHIIIAHKQRSIHTGRVHRIPFKRNFSGARSGRDQVPSKNS